MRKFTILIVLIALAAAAPPARAQSDRHVADGFSLPVTHQYERFDPGISTYNRVHVEEVPGLIKQKAWIYDRTSGAWVFRPQDGLNPAYLVASSASKPAARNNGDWNRGSGNGNLQRVSGSVVSIKGDEVVLREDGGRQVTVNMAEANTRLKGGLKAGDRVSVVGLLRRADYIDARAVREAGAGNAGRSGPSGQPADDWARIHGRVQSIQGTSMRLRADDGRTLTVDLSPISAQLRQALQQGERVTVIGHDWTGPNQLRAEYVQQDSSDPSRGGSVAPSASPAGKR